MQNNFYDEVLKIVRRTKNISLPKYGSANVNGKKTGSAADVVTQVDVDIENFLKTELAKLDSAIDFVGEETGGDKTKNKFWLVDPVDGTGHLVRGMPFCTTMIALVEKGEVIFSAIYDFVNDIMYHAAKGKGAFKNEERIYVSSREIQDSYLSWNAHIEKAENFEIWKKLQKRSVMVKTVSAGFEFAMIANGKLDGIVSFDPHGKDYDIAPGVLLVSEAGGIVKNIGNDKYDYTNLDFIAVNPLVYKALTEGEDAIFPIKK